MSMTTGAATGGTAKPWMAFAACGAIWGSTFLVISIGNDTLAPVWAATLRLTLAALLLGAWTRARGRALPRGAALRAALGYGVAQFGVNLPLLYWGEKLVPSGLSAVVFATIPLPLCRQLFVVSFGRFLNHLAVESEPIPPYVAALQ